MLIWKRIAAVWKPLLPTVFHQHISSSGYSSKLVIYRPSILICESFLKPYSTKAAGTSEKKDKLLQFTTKISDHDLGIKIKKITDLLHKGHTTKITIKNMNPEDTKVTI